MFASNEPKITAIVPNFNHGHLIMDCIEAFKSQKFKDFKVVIVDDCSTDNSVETISKLIENDSRFNLIKLNQNIGLINVQNLIIKTIQSKYIYLGAADDYILPGFFSSMVDILEENPEIAFATSKSLIPNKAGKYLVRPLFYPNASMSVFDGKNAIRQLIKTDFLYITGASLIRTEIFKSIGALDAQLGALADGVHMRQLAVTHGYAFVNKFGLIWRRSIEGLSISDMEDQKGLNQKLDVAAYIFDNNRYIGKDYSKRYCNRMRFMSEINSHNVKVQKTEFFVKHSMFSKMLISITFLRFYLKYKPFGIRYLPRLISSQKQINY